MKIKKYLKILLSLLVTFSLLLPSYASLSASDGSAFLTKAEFDSALADFNSRLTTFEAGINSKIDSQVTSYLDRNGIWSPKAQQYNKGKYYDWMQRGTGQKAAQLGWYSKGSVTGSHCVDLYLGGFKAFTANKSGLVYLDCRDDQTQFSTASNRDARSHIGFMVENAVENWMVDQCAKGFIRLERLKSTVPELPLDDAFFVRSTSNSKAEYTYKGVTYSLEDYVDKTVVESDWGELLANFFCTTDDTTKGKRYATLVYAPNASYQLVGFVEKNSQYVIDVYAKYTIWTRAAQTVAITLDPLQAGCGVSAIPSGEQNYRPVMWIDSINVY